MKSSSLLAAAALLSTAFSATAFAQTGRPSAPEAREPAPHVVVDQDVGSYARYLMLNGATREEAVAAARNVDHAPTRTLLAVRARPHADTSAVESR